MSTILLTGFPGFLGTQLLPRVLSRRNGDQAICLVQPKFAVLARQRAAELARVDPALQGRIRLAEGDITRSGLGLIEPLVDSEVAEIYHLAAVYDLGVARELAMQVNVEGTRNVLDLAERCPHLERLQYVSTCYVSGRHPGVFTEEDLEVGQVFNNFYEETKYLAEVEVRARMKRGLPVTIYRPAVTVGDSTTGETQKYDGPYFILQWLLRQPGSVAVLPTVGDLSSEINVVPRDFVVSAIALLAGLPAARGKTYQLADPAPLRAGEMVKVLGEAAGKRVIRLPLTRGLAKWALESVPGVEALLRIPPPVVDYFDHPTRYATRNTVSDLAGSGIRCPPFVSYVGRLVEFVRAHPEVGAAPMA